MHNLIKLPYFNPDLDIDLNVGLLLLILHSLSKSNRGKLLINQEKILAYMYLVKNPVVLDKLLTRSGREGIRLSDTELFSVNSISVNLDPLFNIDWIKVLLGFASSKRFIRVEYRKSDGFMYSLNDSGENAVAQLNGEYFSLVKKYIAGMEQVKSLPASGLNNLLNDIFREHAINGK